MKRKLSALLLVARFPARPSEKNWNVRPGKRREVSVEPLPPGAITRPKPACARTSHGGNAVDAGVATMFAASVTEFSHFGMGGEAPILIRTKERQSLCHRRRRHHAEAGDGRFFARRKPQPFEVLSLDPGGLKGIIPVAGLMPALVPGMVDAGLLALREFGTKTFAEMAARRPSNWRTGWRSMRCAPDAIARSRRFFDMWPDSKKTSCPTATFRCRARSSVSPNLARTLRAMVAAEEGARSTRAPTAKPPSTRCATTSIAAKSRTRSTRSAKPTAACCATRTWLRSSCKSEEPVSTDYRGYKVYKPGFWSQGPAMIEALNILEGFDMRRCRSIRPNTSTASVEALKLAYADRDTYYGDPKFNKIPMDVLLSKEYAAERRKLITARRLRSNSCRARSTARTGVHPSEIGDRALQDRRRADGARHHLRRCDRQRRHDVLGHAIGRLAAVGDRGRHGHPADRARAELPAGQGIAQ